MTLPRISRSRFESGRRVASIGLLCASLAVTFRESIQSSFADSVEYAGRSFHVTSLKELDGGNVAVEVGGQSLFASKAAVGRAVFKIYAHKPELLDRDGGLEGYGSWLGTLPSKGDEEGAELAAGCVAVSPDIELARKVTFYSGLVTSADGQRVLFRAASSIDTGDKSACSALGFVRPNDQLALKDKGHDWLTTTCPPALVTMAQRLIMDGDQVDGLAMLRAAALFSSSGGIGDAARTSLERLDALEKALQSEDLSQLDSALKVGSFDALLSGYFEKRRPEVIAQLSARAVAENKPVLALQALSLLDFSKRNNSHHELVSQALGELRFEDRDVLRMNGVRASLSAYAAKDIVVRQRYLTNLQEWIARALSENKPGEALTLFELLKDVRGDPSAENDSLRGAIAESFVDNGDERSADRVLRGLRRELPWIYRFRLLLKRDIYVLIMVALGGVVILRWKLMFLGILRRMNRARRIAWEAERRAADAAERERYHSQFANDALRADGFMDVDEYAASLKKFRLSATVSLGEIKNAYRHIVKTLHPDLNPSASKEDTDKFIELTRAYERLLVLHAEREQRSKSSK